MADENDAANTGDQIKQGFTDHIVEPARRAGEAMRASGAKVAEGGSAVGVKLIDQAETNAKEAFAAMRQAAGAKDLTEVMRIQGDYLREQAQRGMAQAREVGELIMQFGRDAVTPLRPGGRSDGQD